MVIVMFGGGGGETFCMTFQVRTTSREVLEVMCDMTHGTARFRSARLHYISNIRKRLIRNYLQYILRLRFLHDYLHV